MDRFDPELAARMRTMLLAAALLLVFALLAGFAGVVQAGVERGQRLQAGFKNLPQDAQPQAALAGAAR